MLTHLQKKTVRLRWRDCAANASDVRAVQAAAAVSQRAAAAALRKPVLVSEFGQAECYCPAAEAVQVCGVPSRRLSAGSSHPCAAEAAQGAGVGWIAWELITAHDQFGAFQGLLFPNGTARSAAEVECLRRLAARGRAQDAVVEDDRG